METIISVHFVQFHGFFGYINQENIPAKQIANKIFEIVFYRMNPETKEPKVVATFEPDSNHGNFYFKMNIPLLNKLPIHNKPTAIKPKEKFAIIKNSKNVLNEVGINLWIDADAISLEGPIYKKVNHVAKRKDNKEILNGVNYGITETYIWNGGMFVRNRWYDYQQILDLRYELEEKFKKLRWESKENLSIVDEAVKALLLFKRSCESVLKIWRDGDIEDLVLIMQEKDNVRFNKKKEEDE